MTPPIAPASKKAMSKAGPSPTATDSKHCARRHLRIGWWSVLVFLTLGIALELLHGFKAGWYLDVSNSTRRLMFTLAHAHGTLLGLLNIAFAVSLSHVPEWE